MTKQERAEMYRVFLSEQGYLPKIDPDGDVFFRFEGRGYVIIVDEKDNEFFRLIFPNFWPIENEQERAKAAQAALAATAQTKVTKVFPIRDDMWASVEMFCSPPEAFKAVFTRSLSALQTGVNTFATKMRE